MLSEKVTSSKSEKIYAKLYWDIKSSTHHVYYMNASLSLKKFEDAKVVIVSRNTKKEKTNVSPKTNPNQISKNIDWITRTSIKKAGVNSGATER